MNVVKYFHNNNNNQNPNIMDGINGISFDFLNILFLMRAYISHSVQVIIIYISIKFTRLNISNHMSLFEKINGNNIQIVHARYISH